MKKADPKIKNDPIDVKSKNVVVKSVVKSQARKQKNTHEVPKNKPVESSRKAPKKTPRVVSPKKKPICDKCVEIHKRDTKYPVQCPYCNKIIGCFYHQSGFHKHLTNCKKKFSQSSEKKEDFKFTPPGVGGRPPKYKSVPELEKLIDAYFESCWTEKLDMFGNIIYKKDDKGKKSSLPVMVQIRPYTITGLALAIGTSRKVLLDYEAKDKFSNTIKRAKERCQSYAEESLFIGKNPTGAIFNLKNNYGDWKDKTETEHSGNLNWREEPPK